jgi:hypothetical protein
MIKEFGERLQNYSNPGDRLRRKNEPGKYPGIEKANRFKQLVLHASAEQIISYSRGTEFLNISLADFKREVHVVS